MLIPQLGVLQPEALALEFLVTSTLVGVYLPLQYKLGYERAKYFFVAVIMASPMATAALLKAGNSDLSALQTVPSLSACACMLAAGAAILTVSAFLSIRVYCDADLL